MSRSESPLSVRARASGSIVCRTSVSGEPRGPLCGMGVCFECRSDADDNQRRTCLVPGPPVRARELEADVVIVGAGPGGLAAAAAASSTGARTLLVDEGDLVGGQIWRAACGKSHPCAEQLLARAEAEKLEVVSGASVVAAPGADRLVAVSPGGGVVTIRWRSLILATGARELFLPCPGWTMPGVVGAGGLQALVKGGLDVAGRRIVVAGSGPLLLAVAAFLAEHDADVVLVAEQASQARVLRFAAGLLVRPATIAMATAYRLRSAPTPYLMGTWVREAHGGETLRAVDLTDGSRIWREPCDLLAIGYGLVPNTELPRLLGCATQDGAVVVDAFLRTSQERIWAVGEAVGIGGEECALIEGEMAGLDAAGRHREANALRQVRAEARRWAGRMAEAFRLREELMRLSRPDTIVCRCEDVRVGELCGHTDFRSAKLLTRCGMGPCQGRICGAACRFLWGWEEDAVRPPLTPVPAGLLSRFDSIASG